MFGPKRIITLYEQKSWRENLNPSSEFDLGWPCEVIQARSSTWFEHKMGEVLSIALDQTYTPNVTVTMNPTENSDST